MLSYRTTPRCSAMAKEDENLIERASPLHCSHTCGSTMKRQNRLFEDSSFTSNLGSAFISDAFPPSPSSSNAWPTSPIFCAPATLYPFNTFSSSSFLVEDSDASPSRYRRKRCPRTEEPTFEYDFPRLPASNSTSASTHRIRNHVPHAGLRPQLTGMTTGTQRKEAFPLSPSTSGFSIDSVKTLSEVAIPNRPRSSTWSSDDTLFSEQDSPIVAKDSLDPGASAADIIPAVEEASPFYASPKSLLVSDEDTYPAASPSWFSMTTQRPSASRYRGKCALKEDGEQENGYEFMDGEQEDNVVEGGELETKHSSIEEFKYAVRHQYAAVVMRWQLGVLRLQRRCGRLSKKDDESI
ncbi:hypothetical protein NLJ89_g7840 [Agrocybe chaxingu]|uniref:Uncharacterized protein n=1 Tax=Agrocybe chaxingu TaxID=84603 RepID=A0A9W8MRD2_9AGAR|nr:hypothetical protein NLJ89_g7840 [Agrocybe chaxingu]